MQRKVELSPTYITGGALNISDQMPSGADRLSYL